MANNQSWAEMLKKLPTWVSGAISFITAVIGFVLLVQGQRQLAWLVVAIIGTVFLAIWLVYLSFARTPPLIEGGKGVYRFERYRTWALIGLGLLVGIILMLLIPQQNRTYVVEVISGEPDTTDQTESPRTSSSTEDAACLEEYFSDVAPQRIKTVEVGARILLLIETGQPLDEVIGLTLTDFNRPVGALKFIFFPESYIFKVVSIVDAGCQEVTDYANTSGGDRNTLNAIERDGLQFTLEDQDYALSLLYDSGGVGSIYIGQFIALEDS